MLLHSRHPCRPGRAGDSRSRAHQGLLLLWAWAAALPSLTHRSHFCLPLIRMVGTVAWGRPGLTVLPSGLGARKQCFLGTAKGSSRPRQFSPLRLAGGLTELRDLLKSSEWAVFKLRPRRCLRGDPGRVVSGALCGRTRNSLFLSLLFIKVPSQVFFSSLKFLLLEEGGLKKPLTFPPDKGRTCSVRVHGCPKSGAQVFIHDWCSFYSTSSCFFGL